MTRQIIEQEVLRLLRRSALEGSEREVSVTDPLGADGVGLDSLGLLQFIAALENAFQIEIPEEFWLASGRLQLQDVVDWIVREAGTAPQESHDLVLPPTPDHQWNAIKKVAAIIREYGWLRGAGRLVQLLLRRGARVIYAQEASYVLTFDLTRQPIPTFPVAAGTLLREASPQDLPATNGLWTRRHWKRKQDVFRQRLAAGYTCYVAQHSEKIVAIDWVTDSQDYEPETALDIHLTAGACYGLDLNEHPEYQGCGLGLAILAFSLERCKQRGYRTQYTIVHAGNERMLRTAIQLVGYRRIGRIQTTRWLWWKRSTWQVGERSGDRNVLEL